MKVKAFLLGMKFGASVANSLPFVFLSGVVAALVCFGQVIEGKIAAVDMRSDWQKRGDDAAFKPEGEPDR